MSAGKVTFTTDHFSTYIIVEERAHKDAPKMGDSAPIAALAAVMAAGMCVCVLACRKKTER